MVTGPTARSAAPARAVTAGGPAAAGRDRRLRGPAAVAAVFTLLQLALVVPGSALGWDETVYVSQADPHAPAAFFSAPRARGIVLLVAPAVLPGVDPHDPVVLRVYLSVLSGAALFLSLAVWRPLLPARVLTVAGALFAGLWITLLYGSQAMPNLWVAYGCLIAVGCFLRAVLSPRPPSGRLLAGLAAAVCGVALMRPPDVLWLLLALGGPALLVRSWRRPVVLAALAAGALLGVAEWLVEAELRYGGTAARLRRADEIQGGLGWHPAALLDQLRAQNGRTLCRPCGASWRPVTGLWWFLVPPAVAAGVVVAVRRAAPVRQALLVAAVAGGVLALPYVVLIGYAAPRFLLPAYALLALPVAAGVTALAARGRVWCGLVVAVAAGHLAVQYAVLDAAVDRGRETRAAFARVTAELRGEGLRPPCVVSGYEAVRVGYRLGCASRQVGGHDHGITGGGLRAVALHRPVAVLVAAGSPVPAHARGWRRVSLPALPGMTGFHAYVAPLPARPAPANQAARAVPAGPAAPVRRGHRSSDSTADRFISSGVRQHDIRKATSNHPSTG
ncbi:hypothetical protein [Streptomyces sp. NPDC048603]|uniref:hypothetical protein n=1 Tax=Streptomyces sp. NPDC048603 TaxID=3365577 RepID=UPI00371F9B5B